ncbi:MAG: hypothetical protein KDA75_17125, partial [Planctomycetaceae bacterium]|nr:hypothetical protein [Planctomycetaceae bacterium]
LDQWVIPGGFGYATRIILLLTLLAALGGWIGWKVLWPVRRKVSALYAARELEQTQPELKSNLLTLVDLQRAGRPVAPVILNTMQKRAAQTLSQTDVDEAIDRRPLLWSSYALCGMMAIMFLYVVLSPYRLSDSLWRALFPITDRPVPTKTHIEQVQPGNAQVLRGDQVEVLVDLTGEIPDEVQLRYTTLDQRYVDEPVALRPVDDRLNRFRGVLTGERGRGLLQNVIYRIEAGDARSRDYTLAILQPPAATVHEVGYRFPEYMRLSPRTDVGGAIDAWEGTRVTIRATTNMPVASAVVQYSNDEQFSAKAEEFLMTVRDGTRLEGELQLKFRESDGTAPQFYRVQVKTDAGETDPRPVVYPLRIRRDLPPKIVLHHPTSDIQRSANAIIPLAYRASDPDFLLHSVTLFYKLQGDERARPFPLGDTPLNEKLVESTYRLPLQTLNIPIEPGKTVAYWLEARDNLEPFPGREPNIARTPVQNIEIIAPIDPLEAERRFQDDAQQAQEELDETRGAETEGMTGTDSEIQPGGTDDEPASEDAADRPGPEAMPADDSRSQGDNPPSEADDSQQQQPGDSDNAASNERRNDRSERNDSQPGERSQAPQTAGGGGEEEQKKPSSADSGGGGGGGGESGEQRPGGKSAADQNGTAEAAGDRPSTSASNAGPKGENRSRPDDQRGTGGDEAREGDRTDAAGGKQSQQSGEPAGSERGGQSGDASRRGTGDHASDDRILRELLDKYRQEQGKRGGEDEASQDSPSGGKGATGDSQPSPQNGNQPGAENSDAASGDGQNGKGNRNTNQQPGQSPSDAANGPDNKGQPGQQPAAGDAAATNPTGNPPGDDAARSGQDSATGPSEENPAVDGPPNSNNPNGVGTPADGDSATGDSPAGDRNMKPEAGATGDAPDKAPSA